MLIPFGTWCLVFILLVLGVLSVWYLVLGVLRVGVHITGVLGVHITGAWCS